MTAILTLEDGRDLHRSNLGMSGMYYLIAQAMEGGAPKLKRWLLDVSERASGMQDIDLGGLTDENAAAFWAAAHAALRALEAKHGPKLLERPNAYAANCLVELVAMRADPELGQRYADGTFLPTLPIDLDDLWLPEQDPLAN